MDEHVAPLGHIILIPSHPVFALFSDWYVLSGEAENNNFIVICLTRPGLKPTIYYTLGDHASQYTSYVLHFKGNVKCNSMKMYELAIWTFEGQYMRNLLNQDLIGFSLF